MSLLTVTSYHEDFVEWGEFLHKPNVKFTNFDDIRTEIEEVTNRGAGGAGSKIICSDAINLKIFSPNVVALTLVDLPGLTKVPVGDQPENIEDQIKELILYYIKNPNSIILAVQAANTDFANSDALKIAKDLDPKGRRTLAVLTKIDIMDAGTDAVEILNGNVIPIELGIIGVVNRSQQDIFDKKGIDDQLDKESEFFTKNYPELASRNGTKYLAHTMSRLLLNHIQTCLPALKTRVSTMTAATDEKLKLLGEDVNEVDNSMMLIQLISRFAQAYSATLEGTYGVAGTNSWGQTKIYRIFHSDFGVNIKNIHPTFETLSEKKYVKALTSNTGPRPVLFKTHSFDVPFETVVKEQISQLEPPSQLCVDEALQEMIKNIKNCGEEMKIIFERFPKLADKISTTVSNYLQEQVKITKEMIKFNIEIQLAYINKKHPDFDREAALTPQIDDSQEAVGNDYGEVANATNGQKNKITSKKIIKRALTDDERKNCDILERLISSYFYIVRKTVEDVVPKTIMHSLVNNAKNNIQHILLDKMLKGCEGLLSESEATQQMRRETKTLMEVRK